MSAIFNIVAVPFGYVMHFIYSFVGNYGLSIIIFTLLTKLLMMPLTIKQKKSMLAMQALQPKLLAVQKKWAADRQRMAEETQRIYEDAGVSPMGGCGTMLLTFPIMIGLYYVITQPLTYMMGLDAETITQLASALGMEGTGVMSQMALAGAINENLAVAQAISDKVMMLDVNFFGMNLALTPSFKHLSIMWLIPILSGASAALSSWLMQAPQRKMMASNPNNQMQSTNTMMNLMMPLMSVYFGFILPAGVGIYWITNSLLTGLQDVLLNKHYEKHPPVQD